MVVYSQIRTVESVLIDRKPLEYALAVWQYESGKYAGKYQTGVFHHGRFFADKQDKLKTLDGAIRRLHRLHD